MINNVKLNSTWILFDFGGCLDSDGLHSRHLFLNKFKERHPLLSIEQEFFFQEAYTLADRLIIKESLVAQSSLQEMNQMVCFLIARFLKISDEKKIYSVANEITQYQTFYLKRNQKIINEIKKHAKLGVVSNFSGNLRIILEEHSLLDAFSFVLDSYHEGIEKPDLGIFNKALSFCLVPSDQVCFIGDNLERDILPSQSLGMKTVLISPHQETSSADFTLNSLVDLLPLIQTK